MNTIKTKQYAKALYEIAKDNNQAQDYLDLSLAIIDAANNNEQLFGYLGNPEVNPVDKKELVKDICQGNELYSNWLSILIDTGRIKNVREYIKEFINIFNKEHGITKGYAWTTEPINQEVLNKLEEKLSNKLNQKVMLENKINKEIIGGIKIEVGDNVWENTIKNKLLQLLNEGSEK